MIAISLWEPWATAIAVEIKGIETRSWATDYRGLIAIHAAQTRDHADYIFHPEVRQAFRVQGINHTTDLAFGCVVCTAELVGCIASEDLLSGRSSNLLPECKIPRLTPLEMALGNYEPRRFGWILRNVVRFPKPIPAKGKQGFWHWTG